MDMQQPVGHGPVPLVGARRPVSAPAPPSRFGLRDARAADGAALLALTRAAFAEYAVPMDTLWDAYCRRIAAKLGGAGAAAEHIVAEQGGAIVGSVLLEAAGAPTPAAELEAPRANCPEISLLAVLPTARGQGIGAALLEEFVYDEQGQFLTGTFMDYLLPSAHEVPAVEIVHHVTPSPHTVFGQKGSGESGYLGAPAAISGAINDAVRPLGIEFLKLPIRISAIGDAVAAAQPQAS
jgi:GNAT superfamily N-acetyltransferase